MYFWNTKTLASDIKKGELSEADQKNYYLGLSIIILIQIYLGLIEGPRDFTFTAIEFLLMLAITVAGINWAFKANGGNEGRDFIGRFVSLSFPVMIKIFVLTLVLAFAAVFLIASLVDPQAMERGASVRESVVLLIAVAMEIIYFWRVITHLNAINR